jgi:hypothetical protein
MIESAATMSAAPPPDYFEGSGTPSRGLLGVRRAKFWHLDRVEPSPAGDRFGR